MSFGLKTTNSPSEIRGKKAILGTNLENAQLPIWGVCVLLAAFVWIWGDVSLPWKVAVAGLAFLTATRGSAMAGGRTEWQLMRLSFAKKRSGEVAVNRGASKKYFKKTANNAGKN